MSAWLRPERRARSVAGGGANPRARLAELRTGAASEATFRPTRATLKTEPPYEPAGPFPGIVPEETESVSQRDVSTPVLISQ